MWTQLNRVIQVYQEIHFLTFLKVKVKVAQLCPSLCDPMDCIPWNSPGQNTEVGSLSLLQGILPTQGSKRGLLHCRRILYQLSYQGIPMFLGLALIWRGDNWPKKKKKEKNVRDKNKRKNIWLLPLRPGNYLHEALENSLKQCILLFWWPEMK